LTGSAADRGKDLDRAVRMAVDEVNSAGGVNGRRIHLTVYDDGDQPARARELARQIAGTPALAVLGQVASSAGVAAGAVYKTEQIPAITGAASSAAVTQGNDWFFRMLRDAEGQGGFLADYARYRFDARQIAVLREKGTAAKSSPRRFKTAPKPMASESPRTWDSFPHRSTIPYAWRTSLRNWRDCPRERSSFSAPSTPRLPLCCGRSATSWVLLLRWGTVPSRPKT
jgi:hypothetical protein